MDNIKGREGGDASPPGLPSIPGGEEFTLRKTC